MVHVTFYCQPRRNRPFLDLSGVKQGKIVEVASPGSAPILAFTDVGSAIWKISRSLDANASFEVEEITDSRHTWIIKILCSYFSIRMRMRPYKDPGDTSFPALNKIVALECDGDYYSIVQFVQGVHNLYPKKKPDEFGDYGAFSKLTAISKQDHMELWNSYLQKDLRSEAEEKLRYLEGQMNKAINRGINVPNAQDLLGKMKTSLKHGEFNIAMDTARMIETVIDGATYEHQELSELSQDADDAMMFTQSLLSEARKENVDLSLAEKEFKIASQAVSERDFQRVLEYTSRTKSLIEALRYKHRQAEDQMAYIQDLMANAKSSRKGNTEAVKIFKKSTKAFEAGDYDQVLEFTDEVRRMLNDTLAVDTSSMNKKQKAKHAVSGLETAMGTAREQGLDTREPEKELNEAVKHIANNKLDAAIKASEKGMAALENIRSNFTSASELIRDITNDINEYKNYIDVSKAETLIEDASYAMEDNDYEDAFACANKASDILDKIKIAARPRLSIGFASNTFQSGVWNRCKLNINNSGKAHAKNVELTFSGSVEVMRLQRIPTLKAGERKVIEMAMRSEELGEIPLDMEISYSRQYDGAKYQAVGVKWVKFANNPGMEADARVDGGEQGTGTVTYAPTPKDKKVPDTQKKKERTGKELAKSLQNSYTYLNKSESTDAIFEIFTKKIKGGSIGMCLTRNFPKRIYEKYDLEGTPIIWLTNVEGEGMIRPSDLEKIRHRISQFLKENKGGVILLDGIEYLITHNKYESVLKFVQSLKDQVAISHSILLIPISPSAIETHELKLLEREMDEILEL